MQISYSVVLSLYATFTSSGCLCSFAVAAREAKAGTEAVVEEKLAKKRKVCYHAYPCLTLALG